MIPLAHYFIQNIVLSIIFYVILNIILNFYFIERLRLFNQLSYWALVVLGSTVLLIVTAWSRWLGIT